MYLRHPIRLDMVLFLFSSDITFDLWYPCYGIALLFLTLHLIYICDILYDLTWYCFLFSSVMTFDLQYLIICYMVLFFFLVLYFIYDILLNSTWSGTNCHLLYINNYFTTECINPLVHFCGSCYISLIGSFWL